MLMNHGDEGKSEMEVYDVGELPIFACGTRAIALGADAPTGIYMGSAFDPRHVAMHVMSRRYAHAVLKLGSRVRPTEGMLGEPRMGPKGTIHQRKRRRPHIKGTGGLNANPVPRQLGSSRNDAKLLSYS